MAPGQLNAVEHANFFEQRATEYSKAATKGDWNEVWSAFDNRKAAKVGMAANEEPKEAALFNAAGWRRSRASYAKSSV